jgi:hypothetical protein
VKRRSADLEVRLRWISIGVVILFGAALALGLVLYLLAPDSAVAVVALHAGLILLMLSPAVRMLVATAERLRRRDWAFLVMTAIVAAELGIVVWRATARS